MTRFGAVIAIASIGATSGCAARMAPMPNATIAACAGASSGDHAAAYFPPGTLDPFSGCWYSRFLVALHEPPLWASAPADEVVYRFLWLRTWGEPIAVRIKREHPISMVIASQAGGAGGYDPGPLKARDSTALSPEDWARLEAAIARIDFWSLSTDDPQPGGEDGARWIVEAWAMGRYHIIDRWSPTADRDGELIRSLGLLFLELGSVSVDSLEVY